MSDNTTPAETKTLSKLGQTLQKKGITQAKFRKMIESKYGIKLTRAFICNHVNYKKTMTTDTAKMFARTLLVPMEDIC